jgi:hypothetical protein
MESTFKVWMLNLTMKGHISLAYERELNGDNGSEVIFKQDQALNIKYYAT